MKFEMLKPNKIKVIINSDDLTHWGVSADAVAKNSPETREMFIELLKQAEMETGFNCSNSKLVIEASLNTTENNLTLFVTKVDSDEENALFERISASQKSEIVRRPPPAEPPKAIRKEAHHAEALGKTGIIETDDFEDIIQLCYAIPEYFGGTLYTYKDRYYMLMMGEHITKASEFGTVRSGNFRTILEEHGKLVAQGTAFFKVRTEFNL